MIYFRVAPNGFMAGSTLPQRTLSKIAHKNIKLFLCALKQGRGDRAWGYVIKDHGAITPLKEAVWEFIRQTEHPGCPCRYSQTVIMVFDSKSGAINFRNRYRRNGFSVYEINLKSRSVLFSGDMNWLHVPVDSLLELEKCARKYWTGEKTNNPTLEHFIRTPLTVTSEKIN